jgi:hypothetical protein
MNNQEATIKHTIELHPFSVPNFVRQVVKSGRILEATAIPLSDLDAETLNAMCKEFRKSVFIKAGKALD